MGDVCDPDDDNDGNPDGSDPCPFDPLDLCLAPSEPSATDLGSVPPLIVDDITAATLTVQEVAGATQYVVYDNAIGNWYSNPTGCSAPWSTLGGGLVQIDYAVGDNTWVAVAARNGGNESSAGRDSTGVERKSSGTWSFTGACP
jgi:hypothetical protein